MDIKQGYSIVEMTKVMCGFPAYYQHGMTSREPYEQPPSELSWFQK
jgi:hypothetical protein